MMAIETNEELISREMDGVETEGVFARRGSGMTKTGIGNPKNGLEEI
jgi:hypothetical protein